MSRELHDALRNHLISRGTSPENAAMLAARTYPDVAQVIQKEERAEAERDARILEKREQTVIMNIARAIGFKVYWLSQARDTKQTPGVPDLWMAHAITEFAGWWETKRQVGGTRSSAQIEFGDECEAAGVPYGYGDRYDFAAWLTRHGFTPPAIPQG